MSTRKGGLGRGLDALIPTSVMPTEIKTQSGVQQLTEMRLMLTTSAQIQNNQELYLMKIN